MGDGHFKYEVESYEQGTAVVHHSSTPDAQSCSPSIGLFRLAGSFFGYFFGQAKK